MKRYNIYYNYMKLNRYPMDKDALNTIFKNKTIYKNINKQTVEIPTNKLKVVECTVF